MVITVTLNKFYIFKYLCHSLLFLAVSLNFFVLITELSYNICQIYQLSRILSYIIQFFTKFNIIRLILKLKLMVITVTLNNFYIFKYLCHSLLFLAVSLNFIVLITINRN